MNRRTYLLSTAALTLPLAGCSGGNGDGNGTDSTTAPPAQTTTEPGPARFDLSWSGADEVAAGETFALDLEVTNVGGQPGTWDEGLYGRTVRADGPTEWRAFEGPELRVPAGETETWSMNEIEATRARETYEYRAGDDGPVHGITVTGSIAPQIETVNLVSEWDQFGDTVDNAISTAPAGEEITIADRYDYYAEENTFHIARQVKVRDADGDRVGLRQYEGEQITERNGWRLMEGWVSLDTEGWGPGEYTAEVLIRDEGSGLVSEPAQTTFTLE